MTIRLECSLAAAPYPFRKNQHDSPTSGLPILFVTLFGIPPENHSDIIKVILAKFKTRFRPVFCVTTSDFSALLRHEVAFETFAPVEEQKAHGDLMDWPAYLTAKWALVRAKWRPAKTLAYGMTFERYLDASKAAGAPS